MIKIESRKCITIRKIVEYLGTVVARKLPQTHAVTECDTTSFLHGADKLKFLIAFQWKRQNQASEHNWCFMKSFRNSC